MKGLTRKWPQPLLAETALLEPTDGAGLGVDTGNLRVSQRPALPESNQSLSAVGSVAVTGRSWGWASSAKEPVKDTLAAVQRRLVRGLEPVDLSAQLPRPSGRTLPSFAAGLFAQTRSLAKDWLWVHAGSCLIWAWCHLAAAKTVSQRSKFSLHHRHCFSSATGESVAHFLRSLFSLTIPLVLSTHVETDASLGT
ncbi:MAG: hypothetical protein M1821_009742 [Bathelium mastoideum]|nr:MAG: hypothetical protein M1821_009742 [Bathelium mastoideum]